MIAARIIPALLCRGQALIKGARYNSWRSVGHVAQAVSLYQARGADELVLVDIEATRQNRTFDLSLLRSLADRTFMPLTAGGGIKTLDQALLALREGADKVLIGSALYKDPYLATKISEVAGSQSLVGAIDVIEGMVAQQDHAGQWKPTQIDAGAYARVLETMGVGELFVTDISREGAFDGYNLELLKAVNEDVEIPVILHGGCGTPNHMLQALLAGASGAAAGSMFQFDEVTPRQVSAYLHEHGMAVRNQPGEEASR